jgi:tetratricopeptide (TPR) repeat protein
MAGRWAGEGAGRVIELMMEYAPQPPYGSSRPELADPQIQSGAIIKTIIGGVMKIRSCLCPILCVFLNTLAIAQTPGGASDPEVSRPNIVLSGKVILEDGTPVPGPAAVQTLCKGQRRTVAYSDSNGGFSFTLVEQRAGLNSMSTGLSDASVSGRDGLPIGDSPNVLSNMREWRGCAVQAELAGYTSERIDIISRVDNRGGNIGSIRLHRLANVQGLTVSVTSAAAPDQARKALEKGHEAEKKNNWNAAQQLFQKAVEIYPKYAVAWFELGRINFMKGDAAEAKSAFGKSLEVDPQYVNPYLGLAEIAAQEQKWQEVADLTAKVLVLNPINFPNAWFLSGYANYNLGKLADAEKSAREGLKIDPEHHYPRLEYILGMTLMEEKDYANASEHLQNFLHAVTNPREIAEAKKQLEEVARLSATASTGNEKK